MKKQQTPCSQKAYMLLGDGKKRVNKEGKREGRKEISKTGISILNSTTQGNVGEQD